MSKITYGRLVGYRSQNGQYCISTDSTELCQIDSFFDCQMIDSVDDNIICVFDKPLGLELIC